MSIESWKSEFYPVTAGEAAELEDPIKAIEHSILKWRGLRRRALRKHQLRGYHSAATSFGGRSAPYFAERQEHEILGWRSFSITSVVTCALCRAHLYSCTACPIALVNASSGMPCFKAYLKFILWLDPEPMIKLLKHTLRKSRQIERAGRSK